MSKYGEAAVMAVQFLEQGVTSDPADAWEKAVCKLFPTSSALQNKGCPKGAFLGLCSDGLVAGIPEGEYSRSNKNKRYAVKAVEILRANKFIASQPELLWKKVAGSTIGHNHQMDVVVSLWGSNLVRP